MQKSPTASSLKKKCEFDEVLNNGIKIVCSDFVLVASQSQTLDGPARLGLIVSRKVGESVERNRIKRCVRTQFRLSSDKNLVGRDLVVIARPSLTNFKKAKVSLKINTSFIACLRRLSLKIDKEKSHS
ncbi:MAG: ribonuclease P protein component [Proteobacteria bacterium]|nr:ribonuclease P protein component [Pseudomonadota bacterium]